MSPSSPISKPPSLPSLSSSRIAHSYSVRTHDVFTAPSNSRAVITEPRACTTSSVVLEVVLILAAWAQDEPPSPTDQPDESDRVGHRSIVTTRPSAPASSSRSSFDGLTRESDNRSRWWTFARPRQGSVRYGWRGLDTMNRSQPADDRQPQYLVNLREDNPANHLYHIDGPSSAPFGPARGRALGQDSPRRGRNESQDENRGHYTHMGDRQDAESGEKSTLSRSRKKRFRAFILSNIYVPLVRSWSCLIHLG